MAKRVYTQKTYPLATQITIAIGVLAQNEAALAQGEQTLAALVAAHAAGRPIWNGRVPTDYDVRTAQEHVNSYCAGVTIAQAALDALRAQAD